MESEGQTRQTQIDGASGSAQVQFSHAGGKTGNNRERETDRQTVKPYQPFIPDHNESLIIAYHMHT